MFLGKAEKSFFFFFFFFWSAWTVGVTTRIGLKYFRFVTASNMKHTDGKESRQNLATCAYFVHFLQRTYVPMSSSELIGLTLIPSVLSLKTLSGFMESINVYLIWYCGLLYRGGLWICSDILRGTGHPVAQLVEALRYKSEGRGFHSGWCHWNFFIDIYYGRGVDSASNRNEYQEYFMGVKVAGA